MAGVAPMLPQSYYTLLHGEVPEQIHGAGRIEIFSSGGGLVGFAGGDMFGTLSAPIDFRTWDAEFKPLTSTNGYEYEQVCQNCGGTDLYEAEDNDPSVGYYSTVTMCRNGHRAD